MIVKYPRNQRYKWISHSQTVSLSGLLIQFFKLIQFFENRRLRGLGLEPDEYSASEHSAVVRETDRALVGRGFS